MTDIKPLSGIKLIIYYLGIFMMMNGGILLIPLITLFFYPEEIELAKYFILPGVISIILGYVIQFFFQNHKIGSLEKYQDATLVVSIWILSIVIAAFPFYITGNFTWFESVFEVTSGFSTTGLSVVDVTTIGHIFIIYRTILLFFGGVGFVLVITSAISDRMGMRLYYAEGHSDKLMPNLLKSARMILGIYTLYIVLGIIAYVIAGMPVFDAINHSVASVSTGGFSTQKDSIGFYDSFPIEIITIILMLLGSTNFLVHLKLLTGKWKDVIYHTEVRFSFLLLICMVPLLTGFLIFTNHSSGLNAFRIVLFQLVSALTTTGFQTVPNFTDSIPPLLITSVIILMIIGGGYSSTAGGIKQYRISLAVKATYWSLKSQMLNKNVIQPHYIDKHGRKHIVTDKDISANFNFISLYLIILLIGTLIFQTFGYNFQDSLFEFASSLSTVGLSAGITGKGAHPVILMTSTIGMFLGRLEFYVVYVGFAALFKRR